MSRLGRPEVSEVSALEEAKKAWGQSYEGLSEQQSGARVRGFTAMVRAVGPTT